jgi:hypothetical protein
MSDLRLERFIELYSQVIELTVDYHNAHNSFVKFRHRDNARTVRRILKRLRIIQKEMMTLALEIYTIERKGIDEFKRIKKSMKDRRRGPPPVHKGKKNEQHNRTDESDA